MQINKSISISLECEEVKTLDKAMNIIEDLINVLEGTGNNDLIEFYGMWNIYNKIVHIVSDFEENYPIEIKTI